MKIAAAEGVDVVLAAIVGRAGLESTWAALESKKTVALANKETLVMAGELVTAAGQQDRRPAPAGRQRAQRRVPGPARPASRSEVERLVLTASGGPFKHLSPGELQQVTVAEALEHPTWTMGPKITIDSATMMNKALEIIEARWLFGLDAEQIAVVIHPQSIVHSLVEFVDGSVLAQMSPPDMRLPIQYALYYPERTPGVAERLDWRQALQLGIRAARSRAVPGDRPGRRSGPRRRHGGRGAERGQRSGRRGVSGRRATLYRNRAGLPQRAGGASFRTKPVARAIAASSIAGRGRRYPGGYVPDCGD